MDFIKEEIKKEYNSVGFKNQRRNLKEMRQIGKTTIPVDAERPALLPGKRISKTGKVYWETRRNRSDARGRRI